MGVTAPLFFEHAIIYGLLIPSVEIGGAFKKFIRLSPSFQLATLINPFTAYKLQVSGVLVRDLLQKERQSHFYRLELNESYSFSQSFEVRTNMQVILPTWQSRQRYYEGKITLNSYF